MALPVLQNELHRLAVAARGVLPFKGAFAAAIVPNAQPFKAGESFAIVDGLTGGFYMQLSERPRLRIKTVVTVESA